MWREEPLGNLCIPRKGRNTDLADGVKDGYLPYLGAGQIAGDPIDKYASVEGGVICKDEDVLILWDGERSGLVGFGQAGVVSSTAAKLVVNERIDSQYLYYFLSEQFAWIQNQRTGTGVPHVPKDLTKRLFVKYPHSELAQKKIAKILKSSDVAIEKTQALISKYENIKQGMMQDLFTRGVDENGQLRPSYENAPHLYQETELGWIPKGWKFSSLDGVAPLVTSGSRDWARFYADFGDVFVRIGNLTRDHVNFRMQNLQHVSLGDNKEGTRTKLLENDILISITADLGIIGIVPDWDFDAYINQHIALVRADSNLVKPRYLAHYLASSLGRKQFEMLNDSGAKAGLNLPTIRSLKCYLPDDDEQKFIYRALDAADTNVAKAKNDLDKLKSIKLGLMHDLLTGKVRAAEDLDERKEAMA